MARRCGRVGGAGRREARVGPLRLYRGRRGKRVDAARQSAGVRAAPAAAAHAGGQQRARPFGRGVGNAVAVPILPRAGRRPQHRPSRRRARSGARRGGVAGPIHPFQRRVALDRGSRGCDGRRAAVVPALLGQRPRGGREPRAQGRGVGLLRDRGHARHPDARLASTRPPQCLPAVSPGRGDRPVHERSRLSVASVRSTRGGSARSGGDDARDVPEPRAALGGPRLAPRADLAGRCWSRVC